LGQTLPQHDVSCLHSELGGFFANLSGNSDTSNAILSECVNNDLQVFLPTVRNDSISREKNYLLEAAALGSQRFLSAI
jgi:hypothetical protein